MEEFFVNSIFAKQGAKDFIVTELDVNVGETITFLKSLEDYSKKRNGIVRISVLRSKKDPTKHYLKGVKWDDKPEVTAKEQMPDRETEDLPF